MKEFFTTKRFKVLISILVLLAGVMTYAAANGRLSAAPEELFGVIAVPFQKIASTVSNGFSSLADRFIRIDTILDDNSRLEAENEALRQQLVNYDEALRENEQYKEAMGIKDANPSYEMTTAGVIGRDALEKYYSFTIDKGSQQGVAVKDCVITAKGLVGRVIEVGLNYAKVATILDPSVSVGCMVSRTADNGLVGGSSDLAADQECVMTLLSRDTLAAAGDEVITTGLGGVFPKGIAVGKIRQILPEASGKSMYAVVDPYEDIAGVKTVIVITSFSE